MQNEKTKNALTVIEFTKIIYDFLKDYSVLPKNLKYFENCVLNPNHEYHKEALLIKKDEYDVFDTFRMFLIKLNLLNISNYTKECIYDLFDFKFIPYCSKNNINLSA